MQLLGDLLLDRHNFTTMTRYISSPDNLKLMMNLLKENSRNIQFEAFHVFKVTSPLDKYNKNSVDEKIRFCAVLLGECVFACKFDVAAQCCSVDIHC